MNDILIMDKYGWMVNGKCWMNHGWMDGWCIDLLIVDAWWINGGWMMYEWWMDGLLMDGESMMDGWYINR
jgi:hypothetical protein